MDSTGGDESVRTGFEPSRFFGSFIQTVRTVTLEPVSFFRNLARSGSSGNAVVFAVVCVVVNIVLARLAASFDPPMPGGTGVQDGWLIATLALSPLLAWLGLYILAAVQHLFVAVFVRPGRGFDTTLRISAYASALALFSWIPVVGYLASLYGLYVTMLGIRELHGTSARRALLAVSVPALLFAASTVWSLWPVAGG